MCPLVHFFAEASSINLSFYFLVQPCSCFRLAWNTKNSSESALDTKVSCL